MHMMHMVHVKGKKVLSLNLDIVKADVFYESPKNYFICFINQKTDNIVGISRINKKTYEDMDQWTISKVKEFLNELYDDNMCSKEKL